MALDFDFSEIPTRSQQAKLVDPIDIFQGLAVTDGNINDLWLAQGDALREWNQHRNEKDVAVVLNTGAGKTLVGLLIAQSLVNETQRQIVYACSSIQLVEQTAEKANGYGLPVTTYYNSGFSSDGLYQRAEAPCVTTYQALFNGKTRFASDDIAGVVFDDAHAAEHILRDQFSLTIARGEMQSTYESILGLFKPYHDSVGLSTSYAEVTVGESSHLFLVPPFDVKHNIAELRRILLDAGLGKDTSTMFSWEHIRDHEDLCCLLISKSAVTLTPPTVPISTLPYFGRDVRRVYMSATLRAPDAFARAFGRGPEKIVSPSTTAGECERMIVVPSLSVQITDDVEAAEEIVEGQKALILCPTYARGERWSSVASRPFRASVPEAVIAFRDAHGPEKLVLAGRYDGIDLPGDTCRLMVIDELPAGLSPLERFQWEQLNMQSSFRSTVASRIVQSVGRISRGMSDHGVVVMTGKQLVDWIRLPRNRLLLPKFLQRQLDIGDDISKRTKSSAAFAAAAKACLSRDPSWLKFYNDRMREDAFKPDPQGPDIKQMTGVSLAEAKFGEALWRRDYEEGVMTLQGVLDDAFQISQSTGAWLTLWLGFALEMAGDAQAARQHYGKAYSNHSNIPRLPLEAGTAVASLPDQIAKVQQQMWIGHPRPSVVSMPRTIVQDLRWLNGNGSSSQTEESLRCLGLYLGLNALRPDKEFGTGPDVLWYEENGCAICMEVKSDKELTTEYRKEEVGQLYDHIQWVKDHYTVAEITPMFVGPLLSATDAANPSSDMVVVELPEFSKLGEKLVSALQDAASQTLPLGLSEKLHQVMGERKLLYRDILKSLTITYLQKAQQK